MLMVTKTIRVDGKISYIYIYGPSTIPEFKHRLQILDNQDDLLTNDRFCNET